MLDIFGYSGGKEESCGKEEGRKHPTVRRNRKQRYYRGKLYASLKEYRGEGEAGKTKARLKLEEERVKDKYILAKYGTDKKGALLILNSLDGSEIFLRNIGKFTGLDEEVAIEVCRMTKFPEFADKFWKNLNKFSVGNKFVSYLIKERRNIKKIFYTIKLLLDKKDIFDENDANHINALVKLYCKENNPFPSHQIIGETIYKFIVKNIMKFPNKSLDYSIFNLPRRVGGPLVNEKSFLKFKTYEEHVVSGGKKSHTPGDYYDGRFERLYYNVYEKQLIRNNNLQSMEKMGFGELLSLFVAEDKSGKKEVEEGEIIEMLLSKEIKTGEEIRKDDIYILFRRINEKITKKFLKKLKGVHLI